MEEALVQSPRDNASAAALHRSRQTHRVAVSALFFLQGLCFATWASRIPSIKQQLGISETGLGAVLFALPVGSLLSLLFSGQLIAWHGSRRVAQGALLFYALTLAFIGLCASIVPLIFVLVLFGIGGNLANIAINTQAVHVEGHYGRSIMGSFHGLWSLAGFSAAGIGALMLAKEVAPDRHFQFITLFLLAGVLASSPFLVRDGRSAATERKPFFTKPPKSLVKLGMLALCCMVCEGAMFDWSGVYFQSVVKADKAWLGAGYTAFMCAMATGRFVADWVANRFRFRATITGSGVLIALGLLTAVIFPFLLPATLGFLVVGFGVSSVVPLVYSQAGRSKEVSPGEALTAVSSIGFLGFLAGPPLIGFVAGAASLRLSFLLIAFIGLLVAFLVQRVRV